MTRDFTLRARLEAVAESGGCADATHRLVANLSVRLRILAKAGLVQLDRQVPASAVLDAGAEEVSDLGESFEVISEPTDLVAVRTALQDAGIDYESAEASFAPSVTVPVDLDGARKVLKLIDALEDSDDVQDVYTNIDIPDDVAAILDEE